MEKMILGATIGNCVHVAGVIHFMDIARSEGVKTQFLGTRLSIDALFADIKKYHPTYVAVGYRLTPHNICSEIEKIIEKSKELNDKIIWCFGGTKPVTDVVRPYDFFDFISDGFDDVRDALLFFRGKRKALEEQDYKDDILERIHDNYPYPLLRHHFGRPTLDETRVGIKEIAESKVLDVISLGPDQNAQQFLFHPEQMKQEFDGAGGVPVRTESDFKALKEASCCGNFPLMRCYSGTEDVFPYAELLLNSIKNAWTAIPLFWYNELDGRGSRTIEQSLQDAQGLIRWHARQNLPVEINEPHHWGLRDAHDVIPVAMAYICAYNAKKAGVHDYIAQYMFNNPNGLSFGMDFAKISAMVELAESLADPGFRIYREARAGLALFSADSDVAKGQLASATFMQMAVHPHIIHVVGYCEADHAAKAHEVIESCKIVKGVIRHTVNESFDFLKNEEIRARKDELIHEATYLLDFIKNYYSEAEDPLANAEVLADCVKKGILDAVHIQKTEKFRGNLYTRLIDGKCLACDILTGKPFSEKERLGKLRLEV